MSLPVALHRAAAIAAAVWLAGSAALAADPRHAIAMYGDPALPPDFVSLPYVNPNAPQGGEVVFGVVGGFDALNPHILKGRAPWAVGAHTLEGLMGRNWDEPFTLYALLAESIETGPNREWVEFTLRPEARFSDGTPVTVEDVIWSHRTLGTEGHPRFHAAWSKVEEITQTGPRSLRITFSEPDRELPLIMALRPIFQKAQWEGRAFGESSMTAPIGTGPYTVASAEPGRQLVLERNRDYWGDDLALNAGQHNLDTLRYEYFADANAEFEAFRAGLLTVYRDDDAARWAAGYAWRAAREGRVVRDEIPHQRPTGISGLVFNTRLDVFSDWRVRSALIHAFNYGFIAQTQTGGDAPRITSYFANSELAMGDGPADGAVRDLLLPFRDSLPEGALEGYALPVSDGTARNRGNLREAMRLLREAGWRPVEGVMRNAAGDPLAFEILLQQGSAEQQSIVQIYVQALERLGVQAQVTSVDPAQYRSRVDVYDFGMTFHRVGMSLSPGTEQYLYWGSDGVDTPGSRNLMGVDSAAVDSLIDTMLASQTGEGFRAATRALDRVLTAGRYVVPIWYSDISRVAHAAELHYPDRVPIYGDWIGFLPDVWWSAPTQ